MICGRMVEVGRSNGRTAWLFTLIPGDDTGPIGFNDLGGAVKSVESADVVFELDDMDSGGVVLRLLVMLAKQRGRLFVRTRSDMMLEAVYFMLEGARYRVWRSWDVPRI